MLELCHISQEDTEHLVMSNMSPGTHVYLISIAVTLHQPTTIVNILCGPDDVCYSGAALY